MYVMRRWWSFLSYRQQQTAPLDLPSSTRSSCHHLRDRLGVLYLTVACPNTGSIDPEAPFLAHVLPSSWLGHLRNACTMRLIQIAPLLAAFTSALALGHDSDATATTVIQQISPTTTGCKFGQNQCDETHTTVMVCGVFGWLVAETCSKAGSCIVGSAGNAYCIRERECRYGQWECSASRYTAKFCDHQGLWMTDRKCASPGCCEMRDGRAKCKAECGQGLTPPR
jgi:hypothetical protein